MKKYLFLMIAVAVYFPATNRNANAQCGPEGLTPCCGKPARACRAGEGGLTAAASAVVTKRSEIVRQIRQKLERQRLLNKQETRRAAAPSKINRDQIKRPAPKNLRLFPVAGFEPGIKQSTLFSLLLDNKCAALFEDQDEMQCYLRDGIHFYFDEDGTSDHLFVSRFRDGGMPGEWRGYKFDWDLSYNEWMKLFERLGYISAETKIPGPLTVAGVSFFEGQLTNEVETNRGKMQIVLDFYYGVGTAKPTDRGSLFSISINRM